MPKNIEDIIVPERKRSIRNIPIPESRRRALESSSSFPPPASLTQPQQPKEEYHREPRREEFDFHKEGPGLKKISKKGIWIAAAVAIALFLFAILSIFSGATLSYTPKSFAVSFDNEVFTAKKSGEAGLLYSVIKLSGDKGAEVSASGEQQVSRKASGTIVVYNTSTQSQKLRATTRFQTTDGKIYQVQEAVTIPAKKTSGNEPGSLEVTVYAERAGEDFNIGLSDFTLPGLKGSSLFSMVYARSSTSMTSGFVGMEKSVSVEDKNKAKASLEAALKDELLSEAKAQTPEGFVLLPDLSLVTLEELPQSASSDKDRVTVNMRGHLNAVMFNRNNLAGHLALEKAGLTLGDTVDIIELESLKFSFSDPLPTDLASSEEIKFSVSGQGSVEWLTDETALKTDLVGKHKQDLSSILNNYPTVTSANATIRPFWKSSFPSDSTDILVKKLEAK